MTFLNEVEKLAVIGSNKKYVEIYEALSMPGPKRLHVIESKSTLAAGREAIEAGAVLAVEYIAKLNLIAMATTDFAISFSKNATPGPQSLCHFSESACTHRMRKA